MTQRKHTNFIWFGQWSFKLFLSRWELSEEEESGGSDVETLVNQKQTVVSQTLDKLPVAATKCTAYKCKFCSLKHKLHPFSAK